MVIPPCGMPSAPGWNRRHWGRHGGCTTHRCTPEPPAKPGIDNPQRAPRALTTPPQFVPTPSTSSPLLTTSGHPCRHPRTVPRTAIPTASHRPFRQPARGSVTEPDRECRGSCGFCSGADCGPAPEHGDAPQRQGADIPGAQDPPGTKKVATPGWGATGEPVRRRPTTGRSRGTAACERRTAGGAHGPGGCPIKVTGDDDEGPSPANR